MGSGPWRPGQRPARGFHPPERPQAYVPDTPPPVVPGITLRRGYAASRHPSRKFRFPQRPRAHEVYGGGSGALSGYGTVGAATFVLSLEPGTKITYTWSTDVVRTFSGSEQRSSPFPLPKQRFEGVAFLVDASSRDTRGTLQRAAAAGSAFTLALPYEEAAIASDTASASPAVLNVTSTAGLDWARATQRVAVLGVDGTTIAYGVIQSVTNSTISIVVADKSGSLTFSPIGAAGAAGGRVMPLVQVLLDPSQGFARYPVGVDLWSIHATASVFGWTGADSMGVGATIVTYTQGSAQPLSRITDNDLLIWDRPNFVDGTADEAMLSGAETLDLGALPSAFGDQAVPDWSRAIRYSSSDPAEWQWLKAFLRLCRGRQRAFLLSSNRDDLIFVSTISGGLKVASSSIAGSGDYASWWTSPAHRRLALTMTDATVNYTTVTQQPVDNGDGTLSLTVDNVFSGTIAKISIAEQLRIDNDGSDDIEVTWDGGAFSVELTARAVQEVVVPPPLLMYDTFFSQIYSYSPPPPPPADQEFNPGVLGDRNLLHVAFDRSLTFGGILQSVPGVDGMVITIKNVSSSSFGMIINHEDTNFPPADRFVLAGQTAGTGGVNVAFTFVYSTAIQRWIQIA